MKKIFRTINGVVLLAIAWHAQAEQTGQSAQQTNGIPPATHIVTCEKNVDVPGLLHEFGITPSQVYRFALNGFAAPMDPALVQRLRDDRRVVAVEADGEVRFCDQTVPIGVVRMGITNFPVAHINGNPGGTNAPLNVDVAVLDSGIDPGHSDLNVFQTYSPFGDGLDVIDHGTGVAGVIAAIDNGFGVVGIAPGVRLWNVQAGSVPPWNTWAWAIQAMDYVAENSDMIGVVNISMNSIGTSPYTAIRAAVRYMVNQGTVVVASAGNSSMDLAGPDGVFGTSDDSLPAALPEVMAVSAMDPATDTIASFSNFSSITRTNTLSATNYVTSPGGALDVAAPGVNILTTATNNTYAFKSGTSFAAPHVTGLVALYIAANGRATNAAGVARIRQAIIDQSLPQSQWRTNNTMDPDDNPEPLAMPSENWVPMPFISNAAQSPAGFQLTFQAVPGYDYTAQWNAHVADFNQWSNLSTLSGTGILTSATITDPAPPTDQRYFRLSRRPSP